MGKLMVRIRVSACFLLKKDDRAFYYHNLLTELTGHMLITKTDAYATIALFQVLSFFRPHQKAQSPTTRKKVISWLRTSEDSEGNGNKTF